MFKELEKIKETPLMKQYNAVKAQYPGAILLFRIGDFYETFSDDAIIVSRVLGIVLTKRANGSASHVELAGFPHHSLDSYLPKLVRAGHRVAVCDQLEDPKYAKGIVKRGVTEVVSPGVALNDRILESGKSNYLAAISRGASGRWGVSLAEISTGEFVCSGGGDSEMEKILHSFQPSEILVPRKDLSAFRSIFGEKFYVSRCEDWIFQFDHSQNLLLKHFGTHSLKGYGVESETDGIVAAGAVLHYLRETSQNDPGQISRIGLYDDSQFVWMDRFTVRNLEILEPIDRDGRTLVDTINRTQTPMGARMLRKWLLLPLRNAAEIVRRHSAIETLLKDQGAFQKLRRALAGVSDLERLVAKLASRRMTPREAVALRVSLEAIAPVKIILEGLRENHDGFEPGRFADISAPLGMLRDGLNEGAGTAVAYGGVIKSGINPELDELRTLSGNNKDMMLGMQQREIRNTGIVSLKVGFNKIFGYYLEVTHAHKNKVPAEWVRKQTLTGAERYISDELKTYEEKILGAEERIIELETTLYEGLLESLQEFLRPIQDNATAIGSIDVLSSLAVYAMESNCCKPEIVTEPILDIRGGRHPVIEKALPPEQPYVPNDVFLDQQSQQIMIITGPNMAGKSALLRQTALITLMAQCGSFVPADSATIGIVDKIFTRVGASDNISSGESTFMVEMNETARIINSATTHSLILLDEIGRGTSTYDGVSIAWSLVEYLHETSASAARTMFATHYHELAEISEKMPRVKNYNVSVKEVEGKMIFMRKLIPGGSAHSFGIHVAEMAGMPGSLLSRARELLSHFESRKFDNLEKAKSVQFAGNTSLQLNMFELKDPDTIRLREVLAGCDIDRMTPVEAMLKLQELKQILTG